MPYGLVLGYRWRASVWLDQLPVLPVLTDAVWHFLAGQLLLCAVHSSSLRDNA